MRVSRILPPPSVVVRPPARPAMPPRMTNRSPGTTAQRLVQPQLHQVRPARLDGGGVQHGHVGHDLGGADVHVDVGVILQRLRRRGHQAQLGLDHAHRRPSAARTAPRRGRGCPRDMSARFSATHSPARATVSSWP